MKKIVRKMLASALVLVLGTGVFASSAEAATLNWHLRYVKGAPSTECIYSWSSGNVVSTRTTAAMKVSNMNGNASVHVIIGDYNNAYTSSTIGGNGGASLKVKKNVRVYASARLVYYGSGNINPAGSFTY